MNNVLTCIDGSAISRPVCDAGSWASQRLGVTLKLLHVLDKSEYPASKDLSGNIGLGSREHLLEELVALDEQRSRVALEHGKYMLEDAAKRAEEKGATDVARLQRHGDLLETLLELEENTRLLVMGRLGQGHEAAAHTVGSHLESVVRAMHRPILIAVPEFTKPQSVMIAYDGSATAQKALEMVAASPLLESLPCHLVMVDGDSDERRQQLEHAKAKLKDAGFAVTTATLKGEVADALITYQRDNQLDLIVMGAYGHSRIRQFFVGSNTTRMISMSDVPLLLLR
ncbi:universal stress protein [Proteobacteria bacterium 005FR1]|nr:universal stress protein [Proteobacteria bacterium 005FR1]